MHQNSFLITPILIIPNATGFNLLLTSQLGYSRKNRNKGRVEDILFWKKPLEILDLSL